MQRDFHRPGSFVAGLMLRKWHLQVGERTVRATFDPPPSAHQRGIVVKAQQDARDNSLRTEPNAYTMGGIFLEELIFQKAETGRYHRLLGALAQKAPNVWPKAPQKAHESASGGNSRLDQTPAHGVHRRYDGDSEGNRGDVPCGGVHGGSLAPGWQGRVAPHPALSLSTPAEP